ncbi:MAG: PAS domain-containing protein, partial [Spirochaetales bacterium]|nr:PAS domain-containing protein [Spirochaetales bacterium]
MKESGQADLLRDIKIGIIIINRETHLIEYVNEDAALMAESTPDAMTGKRCFGFICTAEEGFCPVAGNEEITRKERPLVKSDGSVLEIIKTIRPTMLQNIPCYIETFIDQNDIRQFGDLLYSEEERLDRVMTVGRQGIWEYNRQTGELHFDSHFYRMAGYEPGDFPADFDSWLEMVHEDDRQGTGSALKDFLTGGRDSYDSTFMFRRKSGRYMWIRARGEKIVRNDGSGRNRLLCIHQDISQDKEREKRTLLRNSLQMQLLKPVPFLEKAHLICRTALLSTSSDRVEIWMKGTAPPQAESLGPMAKAVRAGLDPEEIPFAFVESVLSAGSSGSTEMEGDRGLTGYQLRGSDDRAIGALVLRSN